MHFRPRLLCEVVYAFRLDGLRVGGWWHLAGLRVNGYLVYVGLRVKI